MSNNIQLKMKVKTLKIEKILDKVYHSIVGCRSFAVDLRPFVQG